MKEVTRTTDTSLTFSGALNTTYTFNVVATVGELKSPPASVTLQLGEQEEPEKEPEENVEEEPVFEENNDETENPGDPIQTITKGTKGITEIKGIKEITGTMKIKGIQGTTEILGIMETTEHLAEKRKNLNLVMKL